MGLLRRGDLSSVRKGEPIENEIFNIAPLDAFRYNITNSRDTCFRCT